MRAFNKDLDAIRQKIAGNFKKLDEKIDAVFELEYQTSTMKYQQEQLKAKAKHDLTERLKVLKPHTSIKHDTIHLKYNAVNHFHPINFTVKNEFTLFKKLYYYHFYSGHHVTIPYSDEYASLSGALDLHAVTSTQIFDNYVVHVAGKRDIKLVDRKFNELKKVIVEDDFRAQVYSLNQSYVLCLLYTENFKNMFVYMFNAQLKYRRHRRITKLLNGQLESLVSISVHQCEPKTFVLEFNLNSNTLTKYFVFDFSLKMVKKGCDTAYLKTSGMSVYYPSKERFIFHKGNKVFMLSILKNQVKETKLIMSLLEADFSLVVDVDGYIYILKNYASKRQVLVYCYDVNGKVLFKNLISSELLSSFGSLNSFNNRLYLYGAVGPMAVI
jgi:hypothetical protein